MGRLLVIFLTVLATGCATSSGVTSSFSSGADTKKITEKEQRLWSEANDYDATLKLSGQVYRDRQIDRYLQSVMDRLYPEFKGKIRVRMFNSTQLGAFALPNGSIYFNVGLLARIDNEAQLATVLGHEGAHFIYKHSFKERVRAKNASAFASFGVPLGNLIAISSITGYSRTFEREADNKGFTRMVKAGYDPRESYKVFEYLAKEVKALGMKEPYFFSTHPRLVERIENFKELSKNSRHGGKKGYQQYNRLMRPLRLHVLKADLGQDRYKDIILVMTEKRANRLYPAAAQYYLGEAYSRRGKKGDDKLALRAFHLAIKRAPNFAPTYKVLGVRYMKKRNKGKARYYFQRYLALAPKDARDRAYVKSYMSAL
ncbi:MAG: M48 family metalloprotease [Acidiferrobacterales bacterium]